MPLAVARPTIVVNGRASTVLTGALLALTIDEPPSAPATCRATFSNWGGSGRPGFQFFDRKLLEFGVPLRVLFGDALAFEGRILSIDAAFTAGTAPTVAVGAADRLIDLQMTRRSRTFEQVSDADLVARIAAEHGLTADVVLAGEPHPAVAQLQQSDLQLLQSRLAAAGAVLWVDGNTVRVRPALARDGAMVVLTWGQALRSFDVSADLTAQWTRTAVSGWDVDAATAVSAAVDGSPVSDALGGPASGAALLARRLGERVDAAGSPAFSDTQAAQRVAERRAGVAALGFVAGRGVCDPAPELHGGTRVRLDGLGPLFSREYVVTGVRHLFDATDGLRTEFSAAAAAIS